MSDTQPVILTFKDFALLESLLHSSNDAFSGAAILIRRKLRSAALVFPADIDASVVTLNSWVRYRINDGRTEERIVVAGASEKVLGLTVALNSARGIALIGASAGQSLEVPRPDGSFETLCVEAVTYQPESQRRPDPISSIIADAMPDSAKPNAVSLLSAYRLRRVGAELDRDDGDDPGPSAA